MKTLHLEISDCLECPYCQFVSESYHPHWYCNRSWRGIQDETEKVNEMNATEIEIPEWCELEDKKWGG